MPRHVILLTDAHEAPAYELIEALRLAGVQTLIEGLRDAEVEAALVQRREANSSSDHLPEAPVAILYEVFAGADLVELRGALDHAKTFWPGTPIIACRRHVPGFHGFGARGLDGATLKRLGFRAIADKAAQLPALLHEIEGHGATGELKLPEAAKSPPQPGIPSLPSGLKSASLRAAFDLVSSLHFIGDQNDAACAALTRLTDLARADAWTIYLLAEQKGPEAATLEAVASVKPDERGNVQTNEGSPPALLAGQQLTLGGESQAARLAGAGMGSIRKKEHGHHVIAVPLICGERILGVLEGRRQHKGFKKSEAALLDALSLPIASALANAVRIGEAERLSQTDDLTKLHNARYLRQFLLNEIRRARRYGSSVAALFLDLDDFKQVNDAHGHLAGSHVLMEMAGVILSSIRDTDAVARYGGDEFVIVLPDTGIELAGTVAERIREKIGRHPFNAGRNLNLSLTASFGVAAFPEHASSPQQLIACADTAMYEAKAANKNCVRFAPLLHREQTVPDDVGMPAGVMDSNEGKVFS